MCSQTPAYGRTARSLAYAVAALAPVDAAGEALETIAARSVVSQPR